eukprot:m51a1_g2783 hypothetical protein (1065) ;mRNA; r:10707-15197
MSAPITGVLGAAGIAVRNGIRAAFDDANLYSVLNFQVEARDDMYLPVHTAENAAWFESAGFFGLTSIAGSPHLLAALAVLSDKSIPIVGPIAGASFLRGDSTPAPGIVHVAPGNPDELAAVLAHLASDWTVAQSVAIYFQNDSTGWDMFETINNTLGLMGLSLMASAHYQITDATFEGRMNASADAAIARFSAGGRPPRAVLAMATGIAFKQLLLRYLPHGGSDIVFCALSGVEPIFTSSILPHSLDGYRIYVAQDFPSPFSTTDKLAADYRKAMAASSPGQPLTYLGVTGYVHGRLIVAAATRALSLYGWPLTRRRFLDTVFRDERTFDLSGTKLGPYGRVCDGPAGCWCNQGGHTVYVVQLLAGGRGFVPVPTSTLSFPTCGYVWKRGRVAVVGQSAPVEGALASTGLAVRTGVASAFSEFNNAGSGTNVVLATMDDGYSAEAAADNARTFVARDDVVSLLGVYGTDPSLAIADAIPESLPLFAPFSGAQLLRRPFRRNVVNLRASFWDEMHVAVEYVVGSLGRQRVGMVYQNDHAGNDARVGAEKALAQHGLKLAALYAYDRTTADVSAGIEQMKLAEAEAFILLSTETPAALFISAVRRAKPGAVFVCSSTVTDGVVAKLAALNDTMSNVFRTDVLPPLSSTSVAVVEDYLQWVSAESRGPLSLEGFVAGRLYTKLLSMATSVDSKSILDLLYETGSFDVGGLTFGPFVDSCGGGACCNQGSNKIFFTALNASTMTFVQTPFSVVLPPCGVSYNKQSRDRTVLIAVLVPTLVVVVGSAVGFAVLGVMHKKKVSTLVRENSSLRHKAEQLECQLMGRTSHLLNTPAETVIQVLNDLRSRNTTTRDDSKRLGEIVEIISQNRLYQANIQVRRRKAELGEEVDKEIESYLLDTVLSINGRGSLAPGISGGHSGSATTLSPVDNLEVIQTWSFDPSALSGGERWNCKFETSQDISLLMTIFIKVADLSNSMRSWDTYSKWTAQICHEFFLQGEQEKKLGMPVSPFMDKETTSIPKMQSTFLEYIAQPLVESMCKVMPAARVLYDNVSANLATWKKKMQDSSQTV